MNAKEINVEGFSTQDLLSKDAELGNRLDRCNPDLPHVPQLLERRRQIRQELERRNQECKA